MTLLPAGACPSRRASLPTYLTPFQSSTGTDADSGGQPFLPIESKSSRGYRHATQFVTRAPQPPSSLSLLDAEGFRSNSHEKDQLSPGSVPLGTRSPCSSSSLGSESAGMNATNRRRGSRANSKGHNVNFQRVCDDGLTINNEVGDLPSSVSHLIGRTKEAECVKALHIVVRQSYEDEDVWPTTTAGEDGSSSSHRSDGFDQFLWDRIMASGPQLSKGPSSSTTFTSCHSDTTELVRRSTDPQLSSTPHPHNQTLTCVRADANERCKRIGGR